MTIKALRDDFEHALHADVVRAYSLPARFYLDAEVLEREKEAIFYRHWHYVGHLSQLENAGDYVTAQIAEEPVFVMRSEDAQLRGFYNVCRHRAHQLLQGSGRVDAIVCPYHAWTYRTDGRLRHARNAHKVPGFDHGAFCLPEIRVESFCGMVFVNLDHNAEPLAAQTDELEEQLTGLVPFIDELRPVESFAASATEDIAANWKVVVDNYLECYHCHHAHRDFCDLFEMAAYETVLGRWWSMQRGPRVRGENSAYHVASGEAVQHGMFGFLFPTTVIEMFPGQANLYVMSILPRGIDRATFAGHRYALPGAKANAEQMRYFNETLFVEDQDLCESVQRGMRSRSYNQGRFIHSADDSGISEHAVHQFHRLVRDALEAPA